MFAMWQYRFAVVIILTPNWVLDRSFSNAAPFNGKGNVDIFNLLLGLYKLNPLKASNVYKTFSENMLIRKQKIIDNSPLMLDLNELTEHGNSQIAAKQINEIENMMPTNQPQHRTPEKLSYDIENLDTEKFNISIVLQDRPEEKVTHNGYKNELDDISTILDSTEKYEKNRNQDYNDIDSDNLISTKLMPFSSTVNLYIMTATEPTSTILKPVKYVKKSNDVFEGKVMQIGNNDIHEVPFMNENIVGADVIVL